MCKCLFRPTGVLTSAHVSYGMPIRRRCVSRRCIIYNDSEIAFQTAQIRRSIVLTSIQRTLKQTVVAFFQNVDTQMASSSASWLSDTQVNYGCWKSSRRMTHTLLGATRGWEKLRNRKFHELHSSLSTAGATKPRGMQRAG